MGQSVGQTHRRRAVKGTTGGHNGATSSTATGTGRPRDARHCGRRTALPLGQSHAPCREVTCRTTSRLLLVPQITSQSELSSNNGQATKTSKEPMYWSPYPGWEVPQSWGPGFRGEALLPLRALREAAQRVTRKGNDRHGIPRCGARRRSFDHPAPMAQASSCSSTPAFKSLPRSRARISVPRSELA